MAKSFRTFSCNFNLISVVSINLSSQHRSWLSPWWRSLGCTWRLAEFGAQIGRSNLVGSQYHTESPDKNHPWEHFPQVEWVCRSLSRKRRQWGSGYCTCRRIRGHPCILRGISWRSHCGRIICTWRMGYEFWCRHGCWRLVWWFQENSVWPLRSCVWGGSDHTGTLCRGVICVVDRGVGPIVHLQLIHNHSDECKFLCYLFKSYLTSMEMNFMIFWTMIFWWGWHCGGRPHCGTAGWWLGWLEVSWSWVTVLQPPLHIGGLGWKSDWRLCQICWCSQILQLTWSLGCSSRWCCWGVISGPAGLLDWWPWPCFRIQSGWTREWCRTARGRNHSSGQWQV